MDKIINVAIYVRKSREEETEDTLKRQESALIELCKKNKWKFEIYKEVGSSQDLERPKLQQMLDKVKTFHFDGIVVADLDRLSRNTGHFGTIKEILINYNCFVQIPGKLYDFSIQEDDLFSDIQSVLAKNEYQTIKKRLVRGSRQSAKDGNWMGKKVPIGYKYNRETKRLELSEDAPVIKRMFQEYIDGLSTTDIAKKFTLEGVSTTVGMIWTSSGVSRLLNNVVYRGDSLYGKTRDVNGKRAVKTEVENQILVKNTHQAIIEPKMWDLVQKIKKDRNSRPPVLKLGRHKFSGLIKCGLCGNTHSFQTSKYGRQRINSCQTRHYNSDNYEKYSLCKNKGANLTEFETLFFTYFSQYLNQLEKYIDIIKTTETPKRDTVGDRIKGIERQLKRIEQDTKRVQQGFIMEIFSEQEAQTQIKAFKTQKESLEKEIMTLLSEQETTGTDHLEKVISKLNKFYSGHDNMPETESNEILREFIDSIIYKKIGNQNAEMEIKIVWKE